MFALLLGTAKAETCEFPYIFLSRYPISFFFNFFKELKLTLSNLITNRAELMKKSNGQYFPEEVDSLC